MEDILELVFTAIVEFISGSKFKNPKTRTWALTVTFSLVALILKGIVVWEAVNLFRQGSTVGTIVAGCLSLALLIVFLVFIIRGHKKNWERH